MGKFLRQLRKDTWYHGTTLEGWKLLCENKINIKYNIGNELDFGYGFYLTQNKSQAENYIRNIIKYKKEEFGSLFEELGFGLSEDSLIPVVIEFNISL
ncbi:hypothetical protein AAAC51_23320 [Priestia megaterium]